MDDMVFPPIVDILTQQGRIGNEKKSIFHERFLYHYLVRKIDGWSVKDFLESEKIDQYILYAVTDFTELFIKDLDRNNGNRPKIVCDKNADKFRYGVRGCKVLYPEEMIYMYKSREIQKIIVMSVLHENEIIEELLKRGVLLHDMISIVSVLYS